MNKLNKLLYIKHSNIIPYFGGNETGLNFLILAYHIFFNSNYICSFPFIRKLTFFDAIFFNLLRFWNGFITNFEHTYYILTISLIRVKVSNYSGNIVTRKWYWWDKFICSFQKCRGKFTGVIYQRTLLSKEGAEYFRFHIKSVTYFFWCLKDGVQGIFLLFKNILKFNQ